MIVLVADLEVALEQVDHGQVAGRLAVGDGGGFENQPILHPMGVGELVDEPGLAHAGFAHDGDHLAATRASLFEHSAQVLDLGVAADEARKAAERRRLKRVRAAPAPVSSKISTGFGSPFTGTGPSDLTST